jgi:hypothetical protein
MNEINIAVGENTADWETEMSPNAAVAKEKVRGGSLPRPSARPMPATKAPNAAGDPAPVTQLYLIGSAKLPLE